MFLAISANCIFDAILSLFAVIDSMVYGLVSLLAGLLISLSEIRLSDSLIADFSSRIFVILGILMLFKLTMSLINVVVNPEALTDKQEGTGKIVSRIVIMLVMLLSVNWVFSFAMQAQGGIVRTIPKLLLGTNDTLDGYTASEIENGDYKNSSTEEMAALSLKAFVTKNGNCDETSTAVPLWEDANTISAVTSLVTEVCPNDRSLYVFDYNFGLSTVVGIFLVFVLVGFCVDIAVRVIKLAILQMLAPIPIISYADPKSSKKSFDNWIKMCISAYIELFLKLAVIYFAIYLLGQITSSTAFVTADGEPISGWLLVLLVIAIFFFAKQAPQYIADIFGVKLDSGGSFFGKLAGMAAAGIGVVGGMAVGSLLGGAGATVQALKQGQGLRGALTQGRAGMALGAAQGTGGIKAGFGQWRNQANETARALTGNPNYDTSFAGGIQRRSKEKANRAILRSQAAYDRTMARKNAERQRERGFTAGMGSDGKFGLTGHAGVKGMSSYAKYNEKFNQVAMSLQENDEDYQKLQIEHSYATGDDAKMYEAQMAEMVASKMADPSSVYYDAGFARDIRRRDKYSARANASVERDKAKAAQDTQKQMEAVLKKMGYDKKQ